MAALWLTFDLDGTLAAEPFEALVLPFVCTLFSHVMPAEGALRELTSRQGELLSAGRYVEAFDWERLVRTLGEEKGLAVELDLESVVVDTFARTPRGNAQKLLYPETVPVLSTLRADGFRLALVTNGYARYQMPIIRALGLQQYFEQVLAPDTCGYAKPDPRMLDKLPDRSTVLAHFGDVPSQDILFARRSGIRSVWVRRSERLGGADEGDVVPADLIVQSLWEAVPVLRAWSEEVGSGMGRR